MRKRHKRIWEHIGVWALMVVFMLMLNGFIYGLSRGATWMDGYDKAFILSLVIVMNLVGVAGGIVLSHIINNES